MPGVIFDIKRFSVNDGPGIRTTVFLKGCPLCCRWCHNPEGLSPQIERAVRRDRLDGRTFEVEETIGRQVTAAEVLAEVEKDRAFYDESQGGVTFSGGEPMYQPGFLAELLAVCAERGLRAAVDTSGHCDRAALERIVPLADLFLYDIKHLDDAAHREFTGVSNALILDNLRFLAGRGKELIVRVAVIPGFNDAVEHVDRLRTLLATLGPAVREVHLLPCHHGAKGKYQKLNRPYRMDGVAGLRRGDLEGMKRRFEQLGLIVKIGG
ncbi:MAG TPA: glycyl-radical enzyme activating protein [Candidatus Edwardsbacteria bacterium]|nr:glycyl-radical enzyme activating protein [Candidatus Edwardsbacteria bacterium]